MALYKRPRFDPPEFEFEYEKSCRRKSVSAPRTHIFDFHINHTCLPNLKNPLSTQLFLNRRPFIASEAEKITPNREPIGPPLNIFKYTTCPTSSKSSKGSITLSAEARRWTIARSPTKKYLIASMNHKWAKAL